MINAMTKAIIKQRRKVLACKIYERHNGVVQYGPYKNMRLSNVSNVSKGSMGLKLLGLYEQPVVEKINSIKGRDDFINFGAADGYMSLGPLFNKSFKRSICFEMTEKGRAAVKKNAEINNISEKVEIRGAVDKYTIDSLKDLKVISSKSVILCDIEGAEFEVFTEELLNFLEGATIIIELHDKMIKNGNNLRKNLLKKLPDNSKAEIISLKNTLSFENIEDLECLSDNDRAIVMSEGRKVFGEWLVIEY